jgi:hypothetical protein
VGRAIVLSVVIFAIDLMTPRGVAVGALYLVPVLLTLSARKAWHTPAVAGWCTVLTLLDVLIGAAGAELSVTLTNRALSLLAIWVVVAIVRLNRVEEQRAGAEREKTSRLFQVALEGAPDGMLVTNQQGLIKMANATASRMFGYGAGELIGKPISVLLPLRVSGEHHQKSMALFLNHPDARPMAPGQPVSGLRKDGKELPIECRLSSFTDGDERHAIAAVRDVSDTRALEERLRATQRMESIGRLAGGVAHDFNNILSVIISYGQFVKANVPAGSEAAEDVGEVLAAADRATALTRQLLAFSRKQIIEVRRTDLNELVESLLKMLRRILGEDIEFSRVAEERLWAVEVDPSQIEQVMLNLTVNARHAMPAGGKLEVETSNVTLDEAYAQQHSEVIPGDYVRLAVSDTGTGMTPEVRARLFEPFFTTREVGQGSGLGLATVYGIVKQARGHIWVYSELGAGTSFKIYLPRARGEAERLVTSPPRKKPDGGLERVLVVEDEPMLRSVLLRTLRGAGYTVLEATNGVDALLKCQTCEGGFDLLLTDVVMPQMGGRELAEKITALYPRIQVLYMSGYTENAIVHHGVLEAGLTFLQKPFVPDELLRRVRQLLDARA